MLRPRIAIQRHEGREIGHAAAMDSISIMNSEPYSLETSTGVTAGRHGRKEQVASSPVCRKVVQVAHVDSQFYEIGGGASARMERHLQVVEDQTRLTREIALTDDVSSSVDSCRARYEDDARGAHLHYLRVRGASSTRPDCCV